MILALYEETEYLLRKESYKQLKCNFPEDKFYSIRKLKHSYHSINSEYFIFDVLNQHRALKEPCYKEDIFKLRVLKLSEER